MRVTFYSVHVLLLLVALTATGCQLGPSSKVEESTLSSADQPQKSEIQQVSHEEVPNALEPADDAVSIDTRRYVDNPEDVTYAKRATDLVKEAFGYGPDRKIAQASFDEGSDLYEQRKYEEAVEKFATSASRWPDSALEEESIFYEAESHYFAGNIPDANEKFNELLKKYPKTRRIDVVMKRKFKIGQFWEKEHEKNPYPALYPNFLNDTRPTYDTLGSAVSAYNSILQHDPTGPLADDAMMAIATVSYKKGDYSNADYHYGQLRKNHSGSKHQPMAHLLSIQSKLNLYQGPGYDSTPLDEVDELVQTSLKIFPDELKEQRQALLKDEARIRAQKAQRDFEMGVFYEGKGYNRSARMYYNFLIRDYPETKFAADARERLEAIADKPDVPPRRLSWLTDLLDPDEQHGK